MLRVSFGILSIMMVVLAGASAFAIGEPLGVMTSTSGDTSLTGLKPAEKALQKVTEVLNEKAYSEVVQDLLSPTSAVAIEKLTALYSDDSNVEPVGPREKKILDGLRSERERLMALEKEITPVTEAEAMVKAEEYATELARLYKTLPADPVPPPAPAPAPAPDPKSPPSDDPQDLDAVVAKTPGEVLALAINPGPPNPKDPDPSPNPDPNPNPKPEPKPEPTKDDPTREIYKKMIEVIDRAYFQSYALKMPPEPAQKQAKLRKRIASGVTAGVFLTGVFLAHHNGVAWWASAAMSAPAAVSTGLITQWMKKLFDSFKLDKLRDLAANRVLEKFWDVFSKLDPEHSKTQLDPSKVFDWLEDQKKACAKYLL